MPFRGLEFLDIYPPYEYIWTDTYEQAYVQLIHTSYGHKYFDFNVL